MGIATTGKNLVRDLISGNSTKILEKIGFGIDGTAFLIGDTNLFSSDTSIDACDAVTGWTNAGDADTEVLNQDAGEYKEGTGCLNLPMTYSTGTGNWSKTVSGFDGTDGFLYLWYYITDKSALSSVADSVEITLGTGGFTNYDTYDTAYDDLSNGWNRLKLDISNADGSSGTGLDTTDIDRIKITVKTTANITGNNQRMDYWRFVVDGGRGISDSQNTITMDNATDAVLKITVSLTGDETIGYDLKELALFDDNNTLFLREVFATIDKDSSVQVDTTIYLYIESV